MAILFIADKIKRISLIRDKQEVIKNYLSEIQEEESSFITNIKEEETSPQLPISKPLTPKSLPNNLAQQALISSVLKTPTEEALAFIEKAKIQIKKRNSIINESGTDTTPITSPQHKNNEKPNKNDKIVQNLLSELSLDEDPNDEVAQFNDELNKFEQHSFNNNQTFNNESDNSAQIIDIDKYRIDFTTNDEDNFDVLSASSKQNKVNSLTQQNENPASKANNTVKAPELNGNGDETHKNGDDYDELNVLRENEKNNLEIIKYLQEENTKFK